MLDATRTVDAEDLNIFHIAERNEKGIVIWVNKWDLVDKETNTIREEFDFKRLPIRLFFRKK